MSTATGSLSAGDLPQAGATGDPFANSMAAAMENHLSDLLVKDGKPPLAEDKSPDTRDRHRIFVAIAQGIVTYLKAHEGAISVTIPAGSEGGTVGVDIRIA